jgi:predicted O-methyltransferase YrrM
MLPLTRKELVLWLAATLLYFGYSVACVLLAGRFAVPLVAAGGFVGVVVLAFHIAARVEDRIDDARGLNEAAFALYHALQPVAPLPMMNQYALAPDSALLLHKLVREKSPEVVVETGSGASTLVIGYTLKALGKGRLISLELNEEYARRTQAEVERHGLGAWVKVVQAPLKDVVVDGAHYKWHDTAALADVPAIDVVFDDGPPLYLGPSLRYAALPVMQDKLAPGAAYCLNFVAAEERRTVARWLERDPLLKAEWFRTRKGNVVLRRDTPAH